MKYLIGCIALLLTYTGCSSTETIQQEDTGSDEPAAPVSTAPSWYTSGVHSSSDSLAVYGYSLASASNSTRAAELSTQTAVEYLRFEVDRLVEDIRIDLMEESDGPDIYGSSSFIIQLRNTISELPLQSAEITHQNETNSEGIHYSYARVSLTRTELYELLASRLQDDRFLEQLNPSSL